MRTNRISTKTLPNLSSGKTYYILEIDGRSLEDLVLDNQPEITRGLVPTLLNWLGHENERAVVWQRLFPQPGVVERLPILMCDEDVDLWCTLIMVEVEIDEQYVYWNRFGLENSDAQTPETIRKSVSWFSGIPPLRFDRQEFTAVVEQFRLRLDGVAGYTPDESEVGEK